jgi:HK97 family phage portal protein
MRWPFSKKSAPDIETKSRVLGVNDALAKFILYGSKGGETPASAVELYNESSAVSVPINKIARAFSAIQPVLEVDDDQLTYDHDVIRLLQRPSPFYDGSLFMETLVKDYLITNECHIVGLGATNRPPLELQPISPKDSTPVVADSGLVNNWIISGLTLAGDYQMVRKGNTVKYLDGNLRELSVIRGYSTRDNALVRGQSLLVSAAAEARQHILGNKHNVSMLEKGGRLSLVFHYEGDYQTDDFETLKANVRSQYGGAESAGQIGVSAGGKLNIQELSVNNKDMDYAKLLRIAMDSVALQYDVPLPLVSNESNTFNNFGTAVLALYDFSVLPLADRLFAGLSAFLLPRYGLDPQKYRITYDILKINALRERVLNELKLRKDINIETDNELRRLIAREPYQGGDVILKPANLVPVGTDLETDEPRIFREAEATEDND